MINKRSTTKYEPTPSSLFHLDSPHMSKRNVPHVDPFPLERGELLGGPGFEEYSVVETGETGVELWGRGDFMEDGSEDEGWVEDDEVPADWGFVVFVVFPCG